MILVPVLFGLIGFAIDLGILYSVKGELKTGANALALAAAQQLIGTDTASPYSVRSHEGPRQLLASSQTEARYYADGVARRHQLDVWYTDDDATFSCLARFRPA